MQNHFFDQMLIELLGKSLRSETFQGFLKNMGESPLVEELEGTTYYEFKEKGLTCIFDDNKVLEAIHLYGEEKEGFTIYSDPLPDHLSFQMSKIEVVQKMGNPPFAGGGTRSLLGGVMPNWIKYRYPQYELHIEFKNHDREIAMVTLMVLKNI